jgi:hypothetical protein
MDAVSRRWVLCLVAIVAATTAQAPVQPSSVPPDAKATYLKTVTAINALPPPPYVEFTFENQSTLDDESHDERLHVDMRTSDGYASVEILRDPHGRAAAPAAPELVTNGIYPSSIYRLGDFPLADFGLRTRPHSRPGFFEDKGTPEPEPSDEPRLIGSVLAINIPYRLEDRGEVVVNGRPVYHLGLTPLRDPGHHVLREMWIDEASFLPVRYVAERFVDAGTFTFRYLVTVNTSLVAGHLVNIDADGHFNVRRAPDNVYAGEGRWSISGVSFPTSEPATLFDPAPSPANSP